MTHQPVEAHTHPARKARDPVDKLFVYGTLRSAYNLKLVTGQSFTMEPAVLYNYRRIHPQGGYPFAIHWRGSKIEGQVVHGITPAILKKIDEYEALGVLYVRKVVGVQVVESEQLIKAHVYLGIPEALKPYFAKGVEERDRIEEFVEQSINKYLEDRAEHGGVKDQRKMLSLQVKKELLSEETHSLVRQYFSDAGLPAFIIKHELERASFPSLDWLKSTPKALAYADNYLKLAVKFTIFNQLEERFRQEFRSQVKVSDAYYMHTISALMALKLLISQYPHVRFALSQLNVDRYDPAMTYTDYAVAAIFIADDLYQHEHVQEVVEWVEENRRPGLVPLGAEVEFADLGGRVITAKEGEDERFDSFYYFYDFDLMRRGWKLGAHVDDHGFLTTTHTRTRGFLELAFGRYRLLGDVSKPATIDPWVLSQMINLAIRYMGIRPHSLHLSLQTEPNTPFRRLESPGYLLCLLLLGGDLREDDDGHLREMRIFQREILRPDGAIYFSRFNRHHQHPGDSDESCVVEYQFPRALFDYDYQPLIMALKGFQLEANPYPLREVPGDAHEQQHRECEALLARWAANPAPVSQSTLREFLSIVERGLAKEAQSLGESSPAYVQRILRKIEEQLTLRNKRIQHDYANRQTATHSNN